MPDTYNLPPCTLLELQDNHSLWKQILVSTFCQPAELELCCTVTVKKCARGERVWFWSFRFLRKHRPLKMGVWGAKWEARYPRTDRNELWVLLTTSFLILLQSFPHDTAGVIPCHCIVQTAVAPHCASPPLPGVPPPPMTHTAKCIRLPKLSAHVDPKSLYKYASPVIFIVASYFLPV